MNLNKDFANFEINANCDLNIFLKPWYNIGACFISKIGSCVYNLWGTFVLGRAWQFDLLNTWMNFQVNGFKLSHRYRMVNSVNMD